MRNYNEFINEQKIISLKYFGDEPFTFTIKKFIGVDPNQKLEKFIKKLREYFDYEDCNRIKKYILLEPQYSIQFWLYETAGNAGSRRTTAKFQTKYYNIWGSRNNKNGENSYTLDEFLELGIEGIKEDIEAKEAANKYNL